MRFRYTIKELNKSDAWLLLRIIEERKSTCTDVYSPLYKRLQELQNKICNKKKLSDKLGKGSWAEAGEV